MLTINWYTYMRTLIASTHWTPYLWSTNHKASRWLKAIVSFISQIFVWYHLLYTQWCDTSYHFSWTDVTTLSLDKLEYTVHRVVRKGSSKCIQ